MPRKPTKVDDSSILLLKQYVQKKANLSCTSFADIQQLQFKIKKITHESLSIQTLNRVFGLIKNDFKPSVITLNILARYINYNSFEEFELLQAGIKETNAESSGTVMLITSLFSVTEYNGKIEAGVLNIVKNIHLLMQRDSSHAKEIYPFMASHQFGRKYFYEQFVHVDCLNRNYGEGLIYFLMHCRDKESCFFAYNVLCLRYFLSGQQQQFQYYYEKVYAYSVDEIKTFEVNNIARYYATLVLSGFDCLNTEGIVEEALQLFKNSRSNKPMASGWPYAEMILAEALLLKEEPEAAWNVLNEGQKPFNTESHAVPEEMQTQYALLRLYAGYFGGKINTSKAAGELLHLQARPVFFLSKDYYALLINKLYKEVLPKSFGTHSDRQIELLIKKTGFSFFDKKLDQCLSKKIS